MCQLISNKPKNSNLRKELQKALKEAKQFDSGEQTNQIRDINFNKLQKTPLRTRIHGNSHWKNPLRNYIESKSATLKKKLKTEGEAMK